MGFGRWVYAIALAAGLGCIGCENAEWRAGASSECGWGWYCLQYDDPLPVFDAYFTWTSYGRDWDEASEQIEYFWCGGRVGRGRQGFEEVLQRLNSLPPRSRILMYPAVGGSDWQLEPGYPYGGKGQELTTVLRRRELVLIESPRDHKGRVHSRHRERYHFRHVGTQEGRLKYDAYLTWSDYDGTGDAEKARFVWCGRPVGVGKPGFGRVLWELERLPAGSRVLIYPDYATVSRPYMKRVPFMRYGKSAWADFLGTVFSRNLIILYSRRDHKGNLYPDVAQDVQDGTDKKGAAARVDP